MTEVEFTKLAMAIKTFFPSPYILPNKEAMELWYGVLKDLNYTTASAALNKWVASADHAPSIADIRRLSKEIETGSDGREAEWSQGWEELQSAIRQFGYYNEKAALESMNPTTRIVVSRLGYGNLCHSENEVADRARFAEIYKQVDERETRNSLTPPDVKSLIDAMQLKALEAGDVT